MLKTYLDGLKAYVKDTSVDFLPSVNTKAIFALENLRERYSGYCIKAYRPTDQQTLDIGFDASGWIDELTLIDFSLGGDLYCAIWYDQSNQDKDIFQTDPTRMPRIVHNGVIETLNGKPALSGWDVPAFMECNPISISNEVSFQNVAIHSAINLGRRTWGDGVGFNLIGFRVDGLRIFQGNPSITQPQTFNETEYILSVNRNKNDDCLLKANDYDYLFISSEGGSVTNVFSRSYNFIRPTIQQQMIIWDKELSNDEINLIHTIANNKFNVF